MSPPPEVLIALKSLWDRASLSVVALGEVEAQQRGVSSLEQVDAQHLGPRATMTARTALEAHPPDHTYEAMDMPVLCLHLPTVLSEQRRCRPEDLHNATRDSGHDGERRRGVQVGDQELQVAPGRCGVGRFVMIM